MGRYLVTQDFDGTIANTSEVGPLGIGVPQAYEMAIRDVLGSYGLYLYQNKIGGLQNRAPSELIPLIVAEAPHEIGNQAYEFYVANHKILPGLTWDYREIPDAITELVIRQKLSYLESQIGMNLEDGEVWPRPADGYRDFLRTTQPLEEEGLIDFAILSSGHRSFITKTFVAWGLPQPLIIITDDELRERQRQGLEAKAKPDPFQLELMAEIWAETRGTEDDVRKGMVYMGDDPVKDGEMAKSAGVAFGLFASETHTPTHGFQFSDWTQVAQVLMRNRGLIVEGRPAFEIFQMKKSLVEGRMGKGAEKI